MMPDRPAHTAGKLRSLGICLGASTISMVQVEQNILPNRTAHTAFKPNPQIIARGIYPHDGNPKNTLLSVVDSLDVPAFDRIAVTGRKFRDHIQLTSIPEPEAVEYAYQYVKDPQVSSPAIVSAGGETFMVYTLNRFGQISNVLTGNKCASGTGEFLLQQLRRMNVSLEEAAKWAAVEIPHPVSGRCSVFCKSDCTHATNKGIPKSRVTAGLCQMMANKILELLKKVKRRNIMITGGVAQNRMVIEYLRQNIHGLIVPESAPYFEALGTALWALEHDTIPFPGKKKLFKTRATQFDTLGPLKDFESMVEFKSVQTGQCLAGDECILGLDVGSTTTKAVLLRTTDNAILASVYLRTNGDPVNASRQCYRSILEQITSVTDPEKIDIVGLGVCGSGRQIAGLHALTDNVINEIIAHATAAVHFDPYVDTIFEIGGQDAKYTYITNGVSSDYAMNEACSAGTGSFLEESAYETLGVSMEAIADIAMEGHHPPNFNDQCAAFIASDIKNAIHEGIAHEDIIAGLVYSICMNYVNRVKGNRPVGNKIFMQGGVCYNRAVPHAMAALVGKPIIVPPEPGLMGAFGVALAVKNRIHIGLRPKKPYDLYTLANREVTYGKSFTCKGGKEKCDRRCEISTIFIEGKSYPFGGACNRYYNLRHHIHHDVEALDLVRARKKLVFETYGPAASSSIRKVSRGRIGFNKSFMVNTYYPMYTSFFSALGFDPVVPEVPSQTGIDSRNAPFCYPAELSHGFFYSLLQTDPPPDYLFLPHFRAIAIPKHPQRSVVCPLLQGEPFYLQAAFKNEIKVLKKKGTQVLTPVLDFEKGLASARTALIQTASQMRISRKEAEFAFQFALKQQTDCFDHMKSMGENILREIEKTPDQIAVVIFTRAYSGLVEEANMGIPHKFASRGIAVIPFDFLPSEDETEWPFMYWGMGQLILKAARFVKRHPQLFGTYITNFSCGPDSFILGYFRTIMDRKPSLTLELDSHSADAGLETRVEAFLDIINAYQQLEAKKQIVHTRSYFIPATTQMKNGTPTVITSAGECLPMTDPRVTLLFPSMGKLSSESLATIFKGKGFNTVVHPPANEAILKLGRANTSCKECLPLILTTGTLLNYIQHHKKNSDILVYFMATGSGPCRFGQYARFMEDLVKRLELHDVAFLSLSSDRGYKEIDPDYHKKGFWAVVISDVLEDIRSMLLTQAVDKTLAIAVFEAQWECIREKLETGDFSRIEKQLWDSALVFSRIPLMSPVKLVPRILLSGEIFVRRDGISRQYITEYLADKGFATICAPVTEWLHYCDYVLEKGFEDRPLSVVEKIKLKMKTHAMARYEKRIKTLLSRSGLIDAHLIDMDTMIHHASSHISPYLTGEAVLTVGSAITDVVSQVCGVIAMGPFGCMPNRLSESILNVIMTREGKLDTDPKNQQLHAILADLEDLPFLAIESDGSPFPQLIHAKIEAFCLRAIRLHDRMLKVTHPQRPA